MLSIMLFSLLNSCQAIFMLLLVCVLIFSCLRHSSASVVYTPPPQPHTPPPHTHTPTPLYNIIYMPYCQEERGR